MKDRLDTLDRATLTAWRTTNVLGWTALGVLGAALLHAGVDALATSRLQMCCGIGALTVTPVAQDALSTVGQFTLRALLSVAVAGVIIALTRRVWRRPHLAAAAAAAVYALVAVAFVHQHGAGGVSGIEVDVGLDGVESVRHWRVGGMGVLLAYEALILATVPLAAWGARALGRRKRPLLLPMRSGGRGRLSDLAPGPRARW